MKSLTWCATAATSTVLAVAVFVSAQDNQQQNPPQQNQQGAKQAQPNTRATPQASQIPGSKDHRHGDGQLAACLVTDNEGEVAVAKFVAQKTANSEVKEFANMMAKDHQAFITKLNQFASGTVSPRQNDRDSTTKTPGREGDANKATGNRDASPAPDKRDNAPTANRDPNMSKSTRDPSAPNTQPAHGHAGMAAGGLDHVRIKQEIGRLCVETQKKELSEKKGAKLDECYIGSQIAAHLHMADTLKVVKNYASPELRSVLEEGEKTTAEHLDHARTIMKDLEKDSRREKASNDK